LKWAAIDWSDVIADVNKNFPSHKSYRCYPPNEPLPISAFFKDEMANNIKSIYNEMFFINCGREFKIRGLNRKSGVSDVEFKSVAMPETFDMETLSSHSF
jgi:hypothetical protein